MLACVGEAIPPCGGAGHRSLKTTRLGHHAGLQERPDQRKYALVFDPPPDLIENEAVWKAVKARLDVGLDDPLVVRGSLREMDDLGDRVLRPAGGPVGVAR
jgi:hypothetical protein